MDDHNRAFFTLFALLSLQCVYFNENAEQANPCYAVSCR